MAKENHTDLYGFDYESARQDIYDAGGDPDYLDDRHVKQRDDFLKKMGLNPDNYRSQAAKDMLRREADKKKWEAERKAIQESDPCYITTACIRAHGLPDDCEELTLLRAFRDHWMIHQPEGAEDLREYYDKAPGIVAQIDSRENAASIWTSIYEEMILPCIRLLKEGNNPEVYKLYKTYTKQLGTLYGEAPAAR